MQTISSMVLVLCGYLLPYCRKLEMIAMRPCMCMLRLIFLPCLFLTLLRHQEHENVRYLPGYKLPANLVAVRVLLTHALRRSLSEGH